MCCLSCQTAVALSSPAQPHAPAAVTLPLAGLPCAVATGGNRRQVETSIQAAGLEGFFDAVVTCDVSAHQGRGL